MEKDPRKEVLAYPQRTLFQDGNGVTFMSIGGVPEVNRDGERIVKFSLQTSPIARKEYNLRQGIEVDDQGCLKDPIICRESDLVWLNPYSESNRILFYLKSFKHDKTNMSERESFWKIEAEKWKNKFLKMESENLRLHEENNLIRTNPLKWLKQYGEVHKDILNGVAEALIRKKEE